MSMSNLTIDGEFRYIVQWFNEWSELQRDDFVPILVNYITDAHTNEDDDNVEITSATTPVNMNGLPNDLEFNGRPMSLFQCRIKLFKQWNQKWPVEFKEKLQRKISEIDSKVGEKIMTNLKCKTGGNLTNGYASNEQNNLEQDNKEHTNIEINNIEKLLTTVAINDTITEVLNNETSVDDIETNADEVNNMIEQPLLNNIVALTATSSLNNDDGSVDACENNTVVGCSNTRHNHAINERGGEPVERVVQMQNLQINEENEETDKDFEDVTRAVDQKQPQQEQQSIVTVTVNPLVVVSQTLTTNAEVPLAV